MILALNTLVLLTQLRTHMDNLTIVGDTKLAAYIIPLADAHNAGASVCDERLAFISGFTGSAGMVVVTGDPKNEALLWTDGRYFTQANEQLDLTHWTLMREGLPDTPTPWDYLSSNLEAGAVVGVDPTLYTKSAWDEMTAALKSGGKHLVAVQDNLVDIVWGADHPPCPSSPVALHPIQYSGQKTSDKLTNVRAAMVEGGAEAILFSELDEVAWLLNLRGSERPFASVFVAYILLTATKLHLFIQPNKLTAEVRANLNTEAGDIEFHAYEEVFSALETYVSETEGKIWFSKTCNYAVVSKVPADRQIIKLTPVCMMKAVKNSVEVEGMKNALIRDAAVLCTYYSWLEESLNKGDRLTELSAAAKLIELREAQSTYNGNSFDTISGSGSNGAIIHYRATEETNKVLSKNDMYLVDAGGLYLDGTTDITRTFHFGTPTDHQKECYTRVLKGQMAIARAVFPQKSVGNRIDSFARRALWEVGLDYGHGTGHGIGSYLNTHEQPTRITYFNVPDDQGFRENMFTSNEPGYYEEGAFGIRLENIVRIVNVNLTHNFQNIGFLGIEDLTFVPYQHNLIDVDLLTQEEVDYLNEYQKKCRDIVGGFILANDMGNSTFEWIVKETPDFAPKSSPSNAQLVSWSPLLLSISLSVVLTQIGYAAT